MKKTSFKTTILVFMLVAVAGIHAGAAEKSMVKWHPAGVEAPALCGKCHTDSRSALDHTPNFISRHRFLASQQKQMCDICHRESFCSDCHSHKEELKPSDKFKDSPERALPHRGDYMTQHKIDGRINPAACFKCHGRNNNRRCVACHR